MEEPDVAARRTVIKVAFAFYAVSSWIVLLAGTAAHEADTETKSGQWFAVAFQFVMFAIILGSIHTGAIAQVLDGVLSVQTVLTGYMVLTCSDWLDASNSTELASAQAAAAGSILCTIADVIVIVALGHTGVRQNFLQLFAEL